MIFKSKPNGKSKNNNSGNNKSVWFSPKEGKYEFVMLDEFEPGKDGIKIIDKHDLFKKDKSPGVHHVCIGDNCPGCAAGVKVRERYIARISLVGSDNEVLLWEFGPTVYEAFQIEAEDEPDMFRGGVFTLRKTGKGFDTKYHIRARNKQVDISDYDLPNVIDFLITEEEDIVRKCYINTGNEDLLVKAGYDISMYKDEEVDL